MKNTLKNIQALRGIAVLLVMLLHLSAIEKKYSADTIIPDFFHIGAFGVDVFFVISGFIMVTVTEHLARNCKTALHFLFLRITRIYPLYWLSTAIIALIVTLLPGITSFTSSAPYFLVKSLFLLPQESIPLLSVGWTLVHEMNFYVVFSLFLLLHKQWLPTALLLWSLITTAFYSYLSPTQELQPWLYIVTNPLNLEFTMGCCIALLSGKLKFHFPLMVSAAGFMLAIAGWKYWQLQTGNGTDFPLGGDRVILFTLPSALILAGVVAMEKSGKFLPDFLQKIGDASYSVYLTHVLLLSGMGKIWQSIACSNSILDNIVALPIIFILTLAAGGLCHRWIELKLLSITRRS